MEVKIMIGQGLVYEVGTVKAGRGRPKTRLAISEEVAVCGVEISAKGVTAALVDLQGRVLALERTYYSPRLANLTPVLRRLIRESHARVSRIEAVGVALGENLCAPEGCLWDSRCITPAELKAELEMGTGLPVEIETEMRAMMIGETIFGALDDVESSAIVDVSDTIRAVMVSKGNLYSGTTRIGEISHLVIDPNGPPCPCGQRGCLGAVASSRAVLENYRRLARGGASLIGISDFYRLVAKGGTLAVSVFQLQAEALARACRALSQMTASQAILLTGPIVDFWSVTGPRLMEAIREVSGNSKVVDIRHNSHPEQMRILGAAAVALSRAESRWP
jgi:predicted NBD/HSP70 family sugar kinase